MLKQQHFESGANLSESHRKGNEKVLQELIPQSLESEASAGGAATETLTVPGLLATDTLVGYSQSALGAGLGKTLQLAVNGSNDGELDCTWDDNPGAGAKVKVLVLRDVKYA